MSRLLPLTIFPFLSLMLANLSASAAPLSAEAEGARDQGIVYFEQELYPRAKEQLLRAVAAPGGSEDFRSAYFLAQTNYKLLMVEEAFQSLSRARSLAQSDQERDDADRLHDELSRLFGPVEFNALSPGATRGPIHIESKTRFLNARKRSLFASIQERLRRQELQLPTIIYLPFGRYVANGREVTISREAEERPSVEIYLGPAEGGAASASSGGGDGWMYVGIGAGSIALGVLTYLLVQPETREERVPETSFSIDQ